MSIANRTLRETTEAWVESQGKWIEDPAFAPAITQLLVLADGIDSDPAKASLHSQYGLTYRSLLSERPKEPEGIDELDILLRSSAGLGVSNG